MPVTVVTDPFSQSIEAERSSGVTGHEQLKLSMTPVSGVPSIAPPVAGGFDGQLGLPVPDTVAAGIGTGLLEKQKFGSFVEYVVYSTSQ